MAPTTTMFFTVQGGGVSLAIHENTKAGNPREVGQHVTIGPWRDILGMINPADSCRVSVRAVGVHHCPQCGKVTEPGCHTCMASDCQEAEYHANAARNAARRRRKGGK